MQSIFVNKGFKLTVGGAPSGQLKQSPPSTELAVLPDHIPFVKPKLMVKEGERVRVGSVIYVDKRDRGVKFLSPGAGKVKRITYGPRRVVQAVVIEVDPEEPQVGFDRYDAAAIDRLDRKDLVAAIMNGGLWAVFKELPFRDFPHKDTIPPAIIVNLDSNEPFQPLSSVYLKDRRDLFDFGLQVLKKLCPKILVTAAKTNTYAQRHLKHHLSYRMAGPYPALDPGVVSYFTKQHPQENRSWFVAGCDVLRLAELLQQGHYPTQRVVAVAGSAIREPAHWRTREGVSLGDLLEDQLTTTDVRVITGGAFRGFAAGAEAFLGYGEMSVLAVPLPRKGELLGFARAGYDKPSMSRAFLSRLKDRPLALDCGRHGDERSCVNCGYCTAVCPVDILPQFTLKSVLADEIEEALQHGLLDCVECGVCTYVCPSKIDLCRTLKDAKAAYYKEMYDLKRV